MAHRARLHAAHREGWVCINTWNLHTKAVFYLLKILQAHLPQPAAPSRDFENLGTESGWLRQELLRYAIADLRTIHAQRTAVVEDQPVEAEDAPHGHRA